MHQHLIGVDAETKGNLMHASAFTLNTRESIVHALVSYKAAVNAKKPVASSLHEAHFAPPFCGEPDMVSVAPRVVRGNSGRDGRVTEPADPPELLANNMLLKSELPGIGDVLPLATPAGAEVGTRRLDPIRGRRQDLHSSPHRDASTAA